MEPAVSEPPAVSLSTVVSAELAPRVGDGACAISRQLWNSTPGSGSGAASPLSHSPALPPAYSSELPTGSSSARKPIPPIPSPFSALTAQSDWAVRPENGGEIATESPIPLLSLCHANLTFETVYLYVVLSEEPLTHQTCSFKVSAEDKCACEALREADWLGFVLCVVVPGQALGLWDNVGVPREKWGTQVEPGPEWYNNASAPS